MDSGGGKGDGRGDGEVARFPPAPAGGEGREAREPPSSSAEDDDGTERDIEFLNAMTPDEAERYRGEWIAVSGGGIVAHGRDPERVCQSARDAGATSPYMRYIFASPDEVPWLYVPEQ